MCGGPFYAGMAACPPRQFSRTCGHPHIKRTAAKNDGPINFNFSEIHSDVDFGGEAEDVFVGFADRLNEVSDIRFYLLD